MKRIGLFICCTLLIILTACNAKPNAQEVKSQIESIKNNLKLNMSKDEVAKLLGDHYWIANDNGDIENGSEDFWKYRFFLVDDNYKSKNPDHVIDVEGLRNGKFAIDLFIGWKEGKLHFYSLTYRDNGMIKFYILNPDGSTNEDTVKE